MRNQIILYFLGLSLLPVTTKAQTFLSEIDFNVKYYQSGFPEFCSLENDYWGGGVMIGRDVFKKRATLLTGAEYTRSDFCGSPTAHFLKMPLSLRRFLFGKTLYFEGGLELQYVMNSNSKEWEENENNVFVKTLAGGLNLRLGIQSELEENLRLNISAYLSSGLSGYFEDRIADLYEGGLQAGVVYLFNAPVQ